MTINQFKQKCNSCESWLFFKALEKHIHDIHFIFFFILMRRVLYNKKLMHLNYEYICYILWRPLQNSHDKYLLPEWPNWGWLHQFDNLPLWKWGRLATSDIRKAHIATLSKYFHRTTFINKIKAMLHTDQETFPNYKSEMKH